MTVLITRRTHLAMLAATALPFGPATAQVLGTPSRFQMTVATTASRQAIYALWADPSTWPRWDSQIERVTINGPVRVGARGKLKGANGPESTIEIIAMEPGARFTYAATGPGLRMVFDRRFEAGAATRFTHSVAITGAAAGFLAGRIGSRIQAGLPVAMGRLQVMAEQAAAR